VWLAGRVQRVATRRPYRSAGFRGAAAFEIEDMFVRERGGDDLDEFSRWRREFGKPRDATALLPTVAENLELNDLLALVERRGSIERRAGRPLGFVDVDMSRNHPFLLRSGASSA